MGRQYNYKEKGEKEMEKQILNGKVCRRGLEDIWIVGKEGRVRMCGWTNYYIGNLTEKNY